MPWIGCGWICCWPSCRCSPILRSRRWWNRRRSSGCGSRSGMWCGGCRTRTARVVAVRLIVWFPDDEHVVVALFSGDKARMGDVFYDSIGPRADVAIEAWKRQTETERGEG